MKLTTVKCANCESVNTYNQQDIATKFKIVTTDDIVECKNCKKLISINYELKSTT